MQCFQAPRCAIAAHWCAPAIVRKWIAIRIATLRHAPTMVACVMAGRLEIVAFNAKRIEIIERWKRWPTVRNRLVMIHNRCRLDDFPH